MSVSPSAVPAEIKKFDQWVCWRFVTRGQKQTKIPVRPDSGDTADSTDSQTWGTFDQALGGTCRLPRIAGVGFVFAPDDPYCGIDLDKCIIDGKVVPAAQQIIDDFATYTEVSPSGTGVKLITRGKKPTGAKCKVTKIEGFGSIEIYDQQRFFTITGNRLPNTPAEITDGQPALDVLCGKLWPPRDRAAASAVKSQSVDLDDEKLLGLMWRSKNGDAIRKLWDGDLSGYGDDHSSADLALCNILAFWTGKDSDRMDRLFRGSGLYREKWERQDYREMTLAEAINGCTAVFGDKPLHTGDEAVATSKSHAGEASGGGLEDDLVPLGERDPDSGRLVLSSNRTRPTAVAYQRQFHQHPHGRTLHHYAGMLVAWKDGRFAEIEDAAVRSRIQPWLHDALKYVKDRKTQEQVLTDFDANPGTVKQAFETICNHVHLDATTATPSWLSAKPLAPADELLPCRTCLLHLPTGRVFPATPGFFNINAVDYDPDPESNMPEEWFRFLDQVFEDDEESIQLLQEWFGYCLVSDTSQQKMLLIVGPKRSGKGTIGRVLRRLVGEGNVAGPTTGGLAGNFGLQPLIGKSVAVVSDARFAGDGIQTVVERLLCISGEDALTIDRKHMTSVTMKLPTRFTFLTNELPRFTDSSGALAGRFLILQMNRSFYGQEDPNLKDKLLEEIPGILHWAIEGWKRLRERGHFVQPSSVEEAIQELEDLSSPVGAFVREKCMFGSGYRCDLNDVYAAYRKWCEDEGRSAVATKSTFSRDLLAAAPGVRTRRNQLTGRFYEGLTLSGGAS